MERAARDPDRDQAEGRYQLRLYVAGATQLSARAVTAIEAVCREQLTDNYDLEIIDINQVPGRARSDDILATPTLVKSAPFPAVRLIGDMSDRERVWTALSLVGTP